MNRPPKPHPSLRPNWGRLNEGQRRYSMEQYNLSLIRRGLPIDHPIPEADAVEEVESAASPESGINYSTGNTPRSQTPTTPPPAVQFEDQDLSALIDDYLDEFPSTPGGEEEAFIETIKQASMAGVGTGALQQSVGTKKRKPDNGIELDSGEGTMDTTEKSGGGGGGGGVGGGTGEGYIIPRPILSEVVHFRRYGKVHAGLSFGVASVLLGEKITAVSPFTNAWYVTTSLANIPVLTPRMFITPGEFSTMAWGETCTSIQVIVTQRNVRVAFETAATSTGLATLNQNKTGVVATGLNQHPWIINCSYSFDATETMKPIKVSAPVDNWNSSQLYGVTDNGAANVIPASLLGAPLKLNNYACISIQEPGTSAALPVGPTRGWPDLGLHTKRFDAADFVGKPIATYEYQPKFGMIKIPPGFTYYGNSQFDTNIAGGTKYMGGSWLTGASNGSSSKDVNTSANYTVPVAADFEYGSPIEKSDRYCYMYSDSIPKLQPSLHAGVIAVPSLTTSSTTTTPNSWTDVQTYFDITCEMITKYDHRNEMSGERVIRFAETSYPLYNGFVEAYSSINRCGRRTNGAPYYMK